VHEQNGQLQRNYLYLSFDIEPVSSSPTFCWQGANLLETFAMFRTPLIAGLTVALLGGTALAQPANAPPANMSNGARSAPDYDDENNGPPQGQPNGQPYPGGQPSAQQAAADHDMFCRRDAAARTGYTTPNQAASDEQTRGTVGGTLGGAALGAVIGAGAGNPGLGAAVGAGAGLIAGTAVGADNANHAAHDVQAAYANAYYACMHEDGQQAAYDGQPPPPGYGYPYPPPPPYYYGYGPGPYPYYPYYYGPGYYGPGVSFGFGFGRGGGWRH
jgi:hypothetical protein